MQPEDMTVCGLESQELPELSEFLGRVFNDPDGTFLDQDLLAWKYAHQRPDWEPPRSWVLRNDEHQIVAHIGLLPLFFELPSGPERTWHGMDWASTVPRAGRVLSEQVMDGQSNRFRIGVGGTEKSRHVAPLMGQHVVGSVDTFAMSLRPWKQFRASRPVLRPQRVQALIRNAARQYKCKPPQLAGWSADRLDSFAGKPEFFGERGDDVTRTARSPAILDYLLACPSDCSAYSISRGAEPLGYVLFSHRWGQTRIAELRIASDRDRDWADAYALAIDLAGADPRTCEVLAAGSSNTLRSAMLANGFQPIFKRPIWLPDPCPLADGLAPFELQAADSDAFFIGNPNRPYML